MTETRRLDELWAWQARTWADFCALAVTLSVRAIAGAELVASCPLQLRDDLDRGSGFRADTPLAVDCARAIASIAPRLSIHQAILLHSGPAEGEARADLSAGRRSGTPIVSSFGLAPSGDGLRRGLDAIGRALGAEVEARRARP